MSAAARLMRAKSKPRGVSNSELDTFLSTTYGFGEEEESGIDFNILSWWNAHNRTYPILSLVARDILACPVSTVAVEQTFSAGSNILDPTRTNLSDENLEAQCCLDDWVRAERRTQELVTEKLSDEAEEFFTEDPTTTCPGSD